MLGQTFSPMDNGMSGQQKPTGNAQPVQDAIRILSFRMPTTVGASGITPPQNMQGPTALGGQLGGFPGSNPSLIEFLQRLFGGGRAPSGPSAAPAGAPGPMGPPPSLGPAGGGPGVNITPGDGGPKAALPPPGTLDRQTPDTGIVSPGQSPFSGFNPMPGMKQF